MLLSPSPGTGGVPTDVALSDVRDGVPLEYAAETFEYLRAAEVCVCLHLCTAIAVSMAAIQPLLVSSQVHFRPAASYMSRQPDLSHSMRSILVDWLQEVAEEYQLTMDTLALAIAYLDRFLSKMSVSRSKLQLLGATCMYLAAKFEEIYPPEIAEFVYVTDDTYTKRQVSASSLICTLVGYPGGGGMLMSHICVRRWSRWSKWFCKNWTGSWSVPPVPPSCPGWPRQPTPTESVNYWHT